MEEARGDMFAPQKRSMMMSPVNPPVNGGMAYSSSKRGPTLWISRKDHASEEAAARDQRLMVDILEDLTGETQTNSVYSNKEWIVADWGCAWPETDNTWELLENLQSISASIDAFEKWKAVKKRKGQYGGCNSQLNKKKNQQGLASTSDDASEKTDPTLNESDGEEVTVDNKFLRAHKVITIIC
ncbi:hypothetical protein YC2023_060934 [Brassica napus]